MDIHVLSFFFFFSAYGPNGGMPGGHSVFSEQNPQPDHSGAADEFCAAVRALRLKARAVSRDSHGVSLVAALRKVV
jgi:hypothetical protein